MTVRFAVQLASSTSQPTLADIVRLARRADDLGFHAVYVSDHVALPTVARRGFEWHADDRVPIDPDAVFWEPITLLAHLAARTERVRLGTSVLVAPYRHPVVTAKQLAAVDVMSGGRLVLALGVGWYEEEFLAVGAPPFAERGPVTDEIIEVFRTLWRDHPATFAGDHFRFDAVGVLPKPVQARVPLLIGGNSRAAIRRVVARADGWQPALLPRDRLVEGLAFLDREARRAGRDPSRVEVSLRQVVRVGRPRESDTAWKGAIVGSPEEVRHALDELGGLGVTEIVLDLRTCRDDDDVVATMDVLAPTP